MKSSRNALGAEVDDGLTGLDLGNELGNDTGDDGRGGLVLGDAGGTTERNNGQNVTLSRESQIEEGSERKAGQGVQPKPTSGDEPGQTKSRHAHVV